LVEPLDEFPCGTHDESATVNKGKIFCHEGSVELKFKERPGSREGENREWVVVRGARKTVGSQGGLPVRGCFLGWTTRRGRKVLLYLDGVLDCGPRHLVSGRPMTFREREERSKKKR
jgi:hypothetical protein